MPKQLYKITQFHGGLNNNSDPRDIAESELSEATDVMVDELGKIRLMGGTAAQGAPAAVVDIEPGYGLFQFSHDRINGHLGEHLANTGDFTSVWSGTGDMAADSTDATYTHSSGAGTLIQTAANRLEKGVAAVTYAFTYTISSWSNGNITAFRILGSGSQFAAANTNLEQSDGTHTTTFTSHASDPDQPFTIDVTSDGTASFNIDDVSLKIYDPAETGDDYLVLADNESSDAAVYIYSKNKDLWSESQTITVGGDNDFAASFYSVDGALRISDGNFNANNVNQWYGYIGRTLFKDISPSYNIDEWYNTGQAVSPPNISYFNEIDLRGIGEGDSNPMATPDSVIVDGHTHNAKYETKTILASATGGELDNVERVRVYWLFEVIGATKGVSLTIRVGTYLNATSSWITYEDIAVHNAMTPPGLYEDYNDFYFNIASTSTSLATWDRMRAEIIDVGGTTVVTDSPTIETVTAHESAGNINDNSALLAANNCLVEIDWAANAGASGWQNSANTTRWQFGISFIYDKLQESQITTLVQDDDVTTDYVDTPNGATQAPAFRIHFEDWRVAAWNKRITGCNLYAKEIAVSTNKDWYLQASGDFISGKMTITDTQKDYDMAFDSQYSQYYWELSEAGGTDVGADESSFLNPGSVITYSINSGFLDDEESIISQYKTAVVANRQAYIGNVNVHFSDRTEVVGDAILKSPVNKFDVFPRSGAIIASHRDGDAIVKLEAYADRILIFKKNKMELLNISQDIEFLEDTFMHKGVSHSAAVCKTDFGIAWVNKQGCYIYDGQRVSNLLEKKGRQIIKESLWDTFTTREPMIGYIPKKRQLLIANDITTTGDGATFLYDMVTQSWVEGSAATITSEAKTNFVTDWNGDLVYAHTNGTILKWVDSLASATTATSSAVDIKTKDIDFGNPGQVKKIYKFYVTHRGDTSEIQTAYSINGNAGTFTETISNTELSASSPVTDWVTTEIVPTAAPIECKSIRFRLFSDGDTPANFEINDITIVFRLKGMR